MMLQHTPHSPPSCRTTLDAQVPESDVFVPKSLVPSPSETVCDAQYDVFCFSAEQENSLSLTWTLIS